METGVYRHYSGRCYRVLWIARDADTKKEMVVYQGLYHSNILGFHPRFTREQASFQSPVTIDGKNVTRYEYKGPFPDALKDITDRIEVAP